MNKLIGLFFMVAVGFIATSCDETLDQANCTGCDAAFPYSNANASSCYGTKADCEAATGAVCFICT
jgi:hypothetical protein